MQPLDTRIPKFSGQLALNKLPDTKYFDYEAEQYEFDETETTRQCTFVNPKRFSGPESRLSGGEMDMRWTLYQRDTITGVHEFHIGRHYLPGEYQLTWLTNAKTKWNNAKMIPAPSVAPAASELLPKDSNNMLQAIKTHFMESADKDQQLTPATRSNLRVLMNTEFNVTPLLWRLAVLWHIVSWVELQGEEFRSFIDAQELAPLEDAHTLSKYLLLVSRARAGTVQPVCIAMPTDVTHVKEALGVLRFACSPVWAHSYDGVLPGVATQLPPLGDCAVVNCGMWEARDTQPGLMDRHLVWDVAMMFAGQHGVTSQFMGCVASVGLLWCSPEGTGCPIVQHANVSMYMPAMNSASTLILPLSQNATQWMTEDVAAPQPDPAAHFVNGCADSMLLGCCLRLVGMLHGMPVAMHMARARTELAGFARSLSRYGALHTQAMCQAAQLARTMGATGTLGHIVGSLVPVVGSLERLAGWWMDQGVCYQWDEVAHVLDMLPDNSSLCGTFDPLITSSVAIVNKWYGVENSIAQRCSTPHAMQRLVYQNDVTVGIAVTAAADGSRQIYNYPLQKSYRGVYSDWMFFGPFMRKAAAAEMVFQVNSGQSALTLSAGPIGFAERVFYISHTEPDADLGPGYLNDGLAFDLGGGEHGAGNVAAILPPTNPPGGGGGGGGLLFEDDDDVDALTGTDVKLVSALAGKVSGQPLPPKIPSQKVVRTSEGPSSFEAALQALPKPGRFSDHADEDEEYTPAVPERMVSKANVKGSPPDLNKILRDAVTEVRRAGENLQPKKTLDPPPTVNDTASEGSAGSKPSYASIATAKTDKTTTSATQTGHAKKLAAKHTDLSTPVNYEDSKARFVWVGNEARRTKLATLHSELMNSGSPGLREFASRLPDLWTPEKIVGPSSHGLITHVLAPLTQMRVTEALCKIPQAHRATTARVAANALKLISQVAPDNEVRNAVDLSVRFESAARALAADGALTPNEVIAAVGRERWDKTVNPTSVIDQALCDGVPPISAIPVRYTVKGKDKRRVEYGLRGDYQKDVELNVKRMVALKDEINATRHSLYGGKEDRFKAFTAAYGMENVHDAELAENFVTLPAVHAFVAAPLPSAPPIEVQKAIVAIAEGAPVPEDASTSEAVLSDLRRAADVTMLASVTPDFELPSSDTVQLPGVGSANTGEGAVFGVDNTPSGLSEAGTVPAVQPQPLGRITSALSSMGFSRPSKV